MPEPLKLNFKIDGHDYASAGFASGEVKRILKQLGMSADIIRRVSICMYEGEINMVIHAGGGEALIEIGADIIKIILKDEGPGIPNVALAMREGFSTADENVRSMGFGAGMGLPNIKRYSDDLTIDTQAGRGTTLTVTVFIQGGKAQ